MCGLNLHVLKLHAVVGFVRNTTEQTKKMLAVIMFTTSRECYSREEWNVGSNHMGLYHGTVVGRGGSRICLYTFAKIQPLNVPKMIDF